MPQPVDGLLVVADSPVHRLPAQTKVVAVLLVVLAVVLTPAGAWAVLGVQAALVALVASLARLPGGLVLRRMSVELPFVVFALLMPVVATGPTTQLGPITVSQAGLLGGATLLVKATVGVLAAVVLAATTEARALLAGLERLRLPAVLVAILSFMLRYVVVIAEELRRTRLAREARGGGGARDRLAAVAGGVGTRFVADLRAGRARAAGDARARVHRPDARVRRRWCERGQWASRSACRLRRSRCWRGGARRGAA